MVRGCNMYNYSCRGKFYKMHALPKKLWRSADYTNSSSFFFPFFTISLSFFYWGKCALHTNCTEIVIFYCIYLKKKTGCFEIKTSTTKFPVKCGISLYLLLTNNETQCVFALFDHF